ncbi:MAG: heavy-metal-associated domain-containing protein [Brumimicrobium sp.]
MKSILMLTIIVGLSACGIMNGQSSKKTISIQTNAECGDCKERIEEGLNYTKGVVYAELNLDNKKVEVKYNSKKITEQEIKQIISEIGYDADEVKADSKSQSELPACCQPGGMKKEKHEKKKENGNSGSLPVK